MKMRRFIKWLEYSKKTLKRKLIRTILVGKDTLSRILAEMDDISRFDNTKEKNLAN